MVSATLRISRVLSWAFSSPSDAPMAPSSGAWLNHTKKVMKNTIHDRWRIFIFPVKDSRLKPLS